MSGWRGVWTAAGVALAIASATVAGSAQQGAGTVIKPLPIKITRELVDARKADLQKVLDAYIAGDHGIVGRTFRGRVDAASRSALTALLGDRRALWQRARAAFTIDVAVALDRSADPQNIFTALTLARLGRDQVIARPAAIGTDPVEDRFEALFHQIALALFQGLGSWPMHGDYLTIISPRIVRMAQVTPPVPNRFALTRGLNAAMRCCGNLVPSSAGQMVVVTSSSRVTKASVRPDDAISLFEAAAADPALRVEAHVRGAYLELLVGRPAQALARLDRAVPIADETLAYVGALVRAGAFDKVGPPAAAAEAYAAALQLGPGMQVPAIGRAAALQRAGLTQEAVAAAELARRLPAGTVDPWATFIRADAQFIQEWIVELRGLLR